jgi:DNA (cytosine-5)-methyltransferase 1
MKPTLSHQVSGTLVKNQTMGLLTGGGFSSEGYTIHGTDKTQKVASPTDVAGSLRTKPPGSQENSSTTVVAFQTRIARNGRGQPKNVADALTSCEGGTHADSKPHVAYSGGVRRLTPAECEALQGFPRGYTLIPYRGKPAADGPRYKALGNSMACNVMRWIGRRIEMVEAIIGGAAC